MYSVQFEKKDGRRLWLYAARPLSPAPLQEGEGAPQATPHLRWHPLRGEWVIYAAHRGGRTHHPPPEYCPLCPTRRGGFPTEIPFSEFEVAVFENRFPALHPHAPVPPALPVPTGRADGACEVVVYSAEHEGSLATLPPERRELLVEVWSERCRKLLAEPRVRCVMPFENRGEEVGVTLHHPHGQLYAYPFVPPVLSAEARAFRQKRVLGELLENTGDAWVLKDCGPVTAIVPPFARFPYEVWVVPRRAVPGPWEFYEEERQAFAKALGEVVGRYDLLFDRPFPYVMLLHTAPKGEERTFHFHVEFYPKLRGSGKVKHLAGTELGADAFTVDSLPETMLRELREAQG